MTENIPHASDRVAHPLGGSAARRTFLTALAAGAGALAFGSGTGPASAAANPIPTLPGEVSRLSNQVTPKVKTLYENVLVNIKGDPARLFIPHSARLRSSNAIGAVWFYHATGSTHSSLNSAFKYPAELVTDRGSVSICQFLGGDTYTNPKAQQLQRDGWAYLSSLFTVGVNFLRANSGGGAIACGAYAGKLLPKVRGLYLASAAYDMEKLYASSPSRIGPAYGNSPALIAANNPARLPASAWAGTRVRSAMASESNPDPVIPAKDHGGKLLAKIAPVAVEASSRLYTDGGHQVPSWVSSDMLAAFERWL